jgi:hypothetical protein
MHGGTAAVGDDAAGAAVTGKLSEVAVPAPRGALPAATGGPAFGMRAPRFITTRER